MKNGLLAGLMILYISTLAFAGEPKKYNIISIVTDDQGRWSVGAYGNRESRTPHQDRLAREGVLFTHAFVATPVCSPSRATFLTGRYGSQVGIFDYINAQQAKAGLGLPGDTVTWLEVLQRAGYVTGLIGKWHLGELARFHPRQHGAAHFMGFLGGGARPMRAVLEVNGKDKLFESSLPDVLVDDALQFVRKNKNKSFALCLHFRAPHAPYAPVPEVDSKPFRNLDPTIPDYPNLPVQEVKKLTREYYGSVHSIDRNVGRLLALLDELGLAQNTIVIFTSDHGYNLGHHGLRYKGNARWLVQGPLRNKNRPNLFETSLAVPLLIRWPGVVQPGTKIDHLVSNIDTFASVLGMLELPPPKDYRQEGMDFSPLLRGEKTTWRDALYFQYDMQNGGKAWMRSVRTRDWALIRQYLKNEPDELFDLKSDPGETKNLYAYATHAQTRARLQSMLDQWQRSIDDPLLKRLKSKAEVPDCSPRH